MSHDSGRTDPMLGADPYAIGLADGRRLEREATAAFLRREATGRSPILRDIVRGLADVIARGAHRS